MSLIAFESLLIPVTDKVSLVLEEDGQAQNRDLGNYATIAGLPDTWRAVISSRLLEASSPADRPPFIYDASAVVRGLHALRIFELRDYSWELVGGDDTGRAEIVVSSSLENSIDRDLWKSRHYYGRFEFINYLGTAWVEATAKNRPSIRVTFEVASPKLDYEFEYRSLVEDIGAECQQLLLEWGTPASLNLVADPKKQMQILLEQFLFLRHVLGPDKLDLYFEVILRHSHSRLERDIEWKSFGNTDPSFFVRNPASRGRNWQLRGVDRAKPAEIQTERRFDSKDTPPNQFLKFAFLRFREVCELVLQAKKHGRPAFGPDDAVSLEATSMLSSLDGLLAHPLFHEVGELSRIPFESTTLQRREGYREVMMSWLMLDAAAQLDWPGRSEAYDGTTRDVATLYEYWLYFLLVRAFRDKLGMLVESDPLEKVADALPFCCRADDGRLVINLSRGKESFCRFRWQKDGQELRVHFFYNRSFGRKGVGERGSYSKTFRPDYTLVIIPQEFDHTVWTQAEQHAEAAGRIAYLHFDAKYRGENLVGLFGGAEKEEDTPENERSRASGTVKRIDLYKMHTYNEAIRRTVGSYVLYPGAALDESPRFERYHEIVPGIGAFAVRPTTDREPIGLTFLCDFIRDVLAHQLNKFTQSYRITSSTEDIIRQPPIKVLRDGITQETVALPTARVIMGYMKKKDIDRFVTGRIFYCRATNEDGKPLTLDLAPAQGTILVGWWGPRTGPFKTTNWIARVISCRLVSRDIVKAETGMEPSTVSPHYLLFRLTDLSPFQPRDITPLVLRENNVRKGSRFKTFEIDFAKLLTQQLA